MKWSSLESVFLFCEIQILIYFHHYKAINVFIWFVLKWFSDVALCVVIHKNFFGEV